MPGRSRRVLKLAAWALFVPLGITLVSLAIPLRVWRTGRLETPPLALVRGNELMTPPSRIWVDTDAACGATRTTDPDDCLALVWLAAHGVNLAGLSFGYGNADLKREGLANRTLGTFMVTDRFGMCWIIVVGEEAGLSPEFDNAVALDGGRLTFSRAAALPFPRSALP
jgi:hypothetical protein